MEGIKVFEKPFETDSFEFRVEHPGCDCIAILNEDISNTIVKVLAYAKSPKDNEALHDYYKQQGYSGNIRIFRRIEREENSI